MINPAPFLRVPRASFASLDDTAFASSWLEPPVATLRFADGAPPPSHLRTDLRVFWNDFFLFVLFDAALHSSRLAPSEISAEPSGKTLKLWEHSDVLECFIGPNAAATKRYREFQLAPDGRWIDIAVDRMANPHSGDMAWISNARFFSRYNAALKNWQAAMMLPWIALEADPFQTSLLECNFYRATGRFHGDELLAWSPTGYGEKCFHRVERFGKLLMVGQ